MDKIKTASKIATFIAIASFVFAVIAGLSTYLILQITYSSAAPMEYVALNTLSTMLPYLAVGVFSITVALMSRGPMEDEPEKEDMLPPSDKTTEDFA
jgi:magnesium-transporting ATPase (P-type)